MGGVHRALLVGHLVHSFLTPRALVKAGTAYDTFNSKSCLFLFFFYLSGVSIHHGRTKIVSTRGSFEA